MNTVQKVVTIFGILGLLYLLFGASVGETRRVLTLKYNGNLVEYTCQNAEEYETIMVKSQHDILFYDGEYFFDQAPSDHTRKVSQAKVVRDVEKVIGGDMSDGVFYLFILLVIGGTLALLAMFSAGFADGSYEDHYPY